MVKRVSFKIMTREQLQQLQPFKLFSRTQTIFTVLSSCFITGVVSFSDCFVKSLCLNAIIILIKSQ